MASNVNISIGFFLFACFLLNVQSKPAGHTVIVVGGNNKRQYLQSAGLYNIENGQWRPLADMSVERNGLGVATLGRYVYAIGGGKGFDTLAYKTAERFNSSKNEWESIADMSVKRFGAAVVAFDNHIYAIGGLYAKSIHVWKFHEREHVKEIKLDDDGFVPLEVRFMHDPTIEEAFFCAALYSNVFRVYRDGDGEWRADKVIEMPAKKVDGWMLPEVSGILSDILISMDDRFLYTANWLQGDVRQYDISTAEKRRRPPLVGQCFVGGILCEETGVRVTDAQNDEGWPAQQPRRPFIKGTTVHGSAQMMQLSIDGKRLYVSTSLYSPWDAQFYPDMVDKGSTMVKIDIDTLNGGMKLDEDFLVDFGAEPGQPLAHEMRYPGGDCTSDIYC